MSYKKWIYSGLAIFAGSVAAGVIGTLWGISSSFRALETNETASIDAVRGGIEWAFFSPILFACTALIGLVFVVVGSVRSYRHSQSRNNP